MNKRVWSAVVALAMLLSMICSVFVVSADETQAGQAPLLAADGSGATSLKLTPSITSVALNHEFTVDLSLDNYTSENGWATFTVDLTYDTAAAEYLGYEEKKASELSLVSVEENGAGKLTIIFLNTQNISEEIAADLLTLKFKGIGMSGAPISASFVADSVAGYLANGTSYSVAAGTTAGSYSAATVIPQVSIGKKPSYLTMRLVDKNGDPITSSIKQGEEIRAIVTLNDYYDPWMAMALSLNYDTSKFSYKETGNEDLGAFVSDENGEMTLIVEEPNLQNDFLAVCFMNSDLTNRSLKDGKTSADILELTLVAKADSEGGEAEISTSFVEGGNLKIHPNTEEPITMKPETNDFFVEAEDGKGSVAVSIEKIERPYLTLVDDAGNELTNLRAIQGKSFTINVKINNFKQQWSAMSLIAQFDENVLEIDEDAFETANENPLFGDYVIPYVSGGTLGVSFLSSEGDVGLTDSNGNDVTEGIILKIPMRVIEDADLPQEVAPIKVFFAPDGNISGGEELSDTLYNSKQDDPFIVETEVFAQGEAALSVEFSDANIDFDQNGNPIIKQGDSFTVNVKISKFRQKWSAMSLIAQFDENVFKVDEDAFETANENPLFGDYVIPYVSGGTLGVSILSSEGDVGIDGGEGIVLKIPMTAIGEVDLATIKVFFAPEGNIANGEAVSEELYLNEPVEVGVKVESPKIPSYLTMRLVDENGDPITSSIKQGEEVRAIVTLNDYYDPWMAMALSLSYDTSKFTYKETGVEDLGAFVSDENGEMTVYITEADDPNNPLSVCFISSDLTNRFLKDEKTSADILELTLVAKADAEVGDAEIGTSFMEGGNLKTDSQTEETIALTSKDNDFFVEAEDGKGSVAVSIEKVERAYLTLVDDAGNELTNLRVTQGKSFTVNVKINNFQHQWSAMSLIAQFDENVLEVDEAAFETANENPLFGNEVIPSLSEGTLDVSIRSSEGDVGIDGGEGIVLKIPMIATKDANLATIKVSFAPEGNISEGEIVSSNLYLNEPVEVGVRVVPLGGARVEIELADEQAEGVDPNNLKAGDPVKFKVSVKNFVDAWSIMTLQIDFDSQIFEFDSAENLNPFIVPEEYADIPYFEAKNVGGYLLATWFNGYDMMLADSISTDVMTFTLRVKEGYTLDAGNAEQGISVQFYEEGNYSGDQLLVGTSDPNKEGAFISGADDVTVVVEPTEDVLLVVKVEIAWEEAMHFTYNFGTWNPGKHVWEGRGWVPTPIEDNQDTNWITVTNQCEKELTATFAFVEEDAVSEWLDGYFYQGENKEYAEFEVSVAGNTPETENAETVHFGLEGEPEDSMPEGVESVTLGTIKVTIDVANEEE